MGTFAVLATGPSLTADQVEAVRGRCGVVAVSDAYRMAPWANALVSQDLSWWRHHKDAVGFAGRKFSGAVREPIAGVEMVEVNGCITTGTNSGLLACHVAVSKLGATRLLLLGLDLHGTHFFGKHPEPLKNTRPERFEVMRRQFAQWSHKGVEIINCTPGSSLTCFPMGDLHACLAGVAERSALSAGCVHEGARIAGV